MNKRFTKFVFENGDGTPFEAIAPKGKKFGFFEGTQGELIIKVIDENATIEENSSNNYANPPIPKGYKHTEGKWDSGFVIQRESDGSEFVWIPVGFLDPNGTLDGKKFNERFGRRNYYDDEFSVREYYEEMTEELWEQRKSVEKYGGFYISRYLISDDGGLFFHYKPMSKKGIKPCIAYFEYVKECSSQFENNDEVKSHLIYGCEYDCVLEWIKKSKARTLVFETGGNEETYINNIHNFAGKMKEWTQEKYYVGCCVARYGHKYENGDLESFRIATATNSHATTAFRVALLIK